MITRCLIVTLAVTGLLAVCKRHEPTPVDTTTTTSTGLIAQDITIHELTNASCDRAYVCGEIGPRLSYASMDSCLSDVGASVKAALATDRCPRGAADIALSSCLEGLRRAPCLGLPSGVASVTACSASRLCPP